MSFEISTGSRLIPREQVMSEEITDITAIAAAGFGFDNPTPEILEDIRSHVEEAEMIQIGYYERERVGFALYKELLWRNGT